MKDTDMITACGSCLRACCWQGVFLCEVYRAGTLEKTVAELRELQLEHPDYWRAHLKEEADLA